MRFRSTIITLFFVVFLLTPVLSNLKNPYLGVFLGKYISEGKNFNSELEKEILRRNSSFLNSLVKGYSKVLYIQGISLNEKVGVVGQDGHIFLGDKEALNFSQAVYRKSNTSEEAAHWIESVSKMDRYLYNQNIPLVVIIAPAKWSVYRDKLPKWSQNLNGKSTFDKIIESNNGKINIVDTRKELFEGRKIAETYSPLNSHWTDYGGYVAWQAIGPKISSVIPNFQPIALNTLSSVNTVDGFNEFEFMLGIKKKNSWTVPVLSSPLPSYQLHHGQNNKLMDGSAKTEFKDLPAQIQSPLSNYSGRALVITDSQGASLSPYIQASFKDTVMINLYEQNAIKVKEEIDKLKPNVVIVVVTERNLMYTFFFQDF